MLELNKDKGSDYILSLKSKGLYISKLKPLFTASLHSIKLFEYRMGIKFDKDPLAVEQNNCATRIVNVYILHEFDTWPEVPLNNFKLKNCLFTATNIVKNSAKEKWSYRVYGIAFDGTGSWNFGNDCAKNVVIFGADNSSNFHVDNCKNNFLVLDEGSSHSINGSYGSPEKTFSINFSTVNTKFYLGLHYNGDNSYLFVNEKEIFKFKTNDGIVNFLTQFFLGIISYGFGGTESREVSLKVSLYNFSAAYIAIDKSDILNSNKYIAVKNNMK